MARNSKTDNIRSSMVAGVLSDKSWQSDPYTAGTVDDWSDRYPKVPIVADGRPCKHHRDLGVTTPNDRRAKNCEDCFSVKGRGTTLIDLTRKVGKTISRTDFLSIKTGKIGKDGKFPSRIDLSTGRPETIAAIVDAVERGSSVPVVFWISADDYDKSPNENGFAIFVDVAPIIRAYGVAPLQLEPYKRGQAPACYVAKSSRRITGVPGGTKEARLAVQRFEQYGTPLPGGKWHARSEAWEGPHFDEAGQYWSTPYAVHYSEFRISLSACGIKRADWTPCHLSGLASFVEMQDWDDMSF